MPQCGRCNREFEAGREWCPHCGARALSLVTRATNRAVRYLTILLAAIVGSAVVVAGYWFFELRPRMKRLENPLWGNEPSELRRVDVKVLDDEIFDLEIRLPRGPTGLAWDGGRFVLGNREDPWGLSRLMPDGDEWKLQTVPVIETEYAQTISLEAVTWNGGNFVGIADGSWFQKSDTEVFTIHHPEDLQVTDVLPAPAGIGAIAWDGEHYWVATRNNTETSGEPSSLAKLDGEFQMVAMYNPPGIGCQGLTWDGSFLWFLDVFEDSVFVLDVRQSPPSVVYTHRVSAYPSGIAFDGSHIWIGDYEEDRLRRVRHATRTAWTGLRGEPEIGTRRGSATSRPRSADVSALLEQLRSESWSERMHAEARLSDLGESIPYKIFVNEFREEDTPYKVDVDRFELEVKDGDLVANWDLYIGEKYFSTEKTGSSGTVTLPLFVKYTVSVAATNPSDDVEKIYEPLPGRSLEENVVLSSDPGPGEYSVSIFIHIQYVDPEDGPRILNFNEETLTVEIRP